MSEGDPFGFDVLAAYVARHLARDFPGWRIDRDASGRWSATHDDWGALYARTSEELRGRLRAHATERHGGRGRGEPR